MTQLRIIFDMINYIVLKRCLYFIIVVLFFTSCKKTDSGSSNTFNLLVNKKWTVVYKDITYADGHTVRDSIANWPAYVQDDYIIWYGNYTYDYNDNHVWHPSASSQYIDTGSYTFTNDALTMKSLFAGVGSPVHISSVTADTLVYGYETSSDTTFYKFTLANIY